MGVLQEIKKAGLEAELEKQFAAFLAEPNLKRKPEPLTADDIAKGKKALHQMIDEHGLQDQLTMKKIGELQRAEILKPGLYRIFKEIEAKMKNGGSKPQAAEAEVKPESKTEKKEAKPEEPKAEAKVETKAEPEVESVEASDDLVISDKELQKIKDKVAAEETKLREKLTKREAELRAKAAKKLTKKGQRLGLKSEEAAKIQNLKQLIVGANDKIKELRTRIESWREEINTIRPKKPATAKVNIDAEALEKAKTQIKAFLKKNPESKSDAIVEGTKLDKKMYSAAVSALREANEITKGGRGPYTNYKLNE